MRYAIDPDVSVYRQVPDDRYTRNMSASVGTRVYRLRDADGALLYVGVSSRPRQRWYAHSRTAPWWSLVRSAEVDAEHLPEYHARQLETRAISEERPRFNVAKVVSPHG